MKPTRNKNYDNDGVDINDEVQKIFRKGETGKIGTNLNKLKTKFDQATYDKIQMRFTERHHIISKKAKKFSKLIREKYGLQQLPFHQLLEYSKRYKEKYGLSDEEFAEFQRIYENDLIGIKSPDVIPVSTNLMKVLGNTQPQLDITGFNYKLNDSDYKVLQEILNLYNEHHATHAQVVMQSLEYTDCAIEAVGPSQARDIVTAFANKRDGVHPVVAALFLPKVDTLDGHFLRSNLSRIIKNRYNNEPIQTRYDYELIDSLVNDPNDIVCDNRSILVDLRNRCNIQHTLWASVLSLRSGIYYQPYHKFLVSAIDGCRLNRQDMPDFIYNKNDSTILKRLLAAFSFRPTIVSTQPVMVNNVSYNPYNQTQRSIVSNIPIINFNLPPEMNNDDNEPLNLQSALSQEQIIMRNNIMVQNYTNIIYSREVLFFYVNRQENIIKMSDIVPFGIRNLPITVSGLERLNTKRITIPTELNIKDTEYNLKSVVVSDVSTITEKNNIVGSSAIIIDRNDNNGLISSNRYLHYSPYVLSYLDQLGQRQTRAPLIEIPEQESTLGSGMVNFRDEVETKGILFMYVKVKKDNNNNDLSFLN